MTEDLRLSKTENDILDGTLSEVYQSLDRVLMQLTALKREHEAIVALILEHLGPIEYIGLDDLVRNLLQLTVTQKALIEKMKKKPTIVFEAQAHPIPARGFCTVCGADYQDPPGHICRP